MRIPQPFVRTSTAVFALPFLLAAPLCAQFHWSAAAGPDRDGDWDTIATNWDPAPAAPAGTVAWINGPGTAVFNNAEDGAVSVTAPITAAEIAAGMGGTYTISGGTITAAGPNLNVNVGAAGSGVLNIGSALDAATVTKQGPGTLNFTGTTTGGMISQSGLVTLSGDNLADGATLDVQAGSTVQLNGNDTVDQLLIDGTLSGTGVLTASDYSLLGGAVIDGHLGEGTFTKADLLTVTINGTAASDTVMIPAGTLILSGDNLEDTAALSTQGLGVVQVNGTDTVGTYAQGGTGGLSGAGTLTAASGATLSGGEVSGNLSGDVTSNGPVTISGSVGGGSLAVDAGTLTLSGTSTSTAVTIASGATFDDDNGGLDGGATVTNAGTLNINNVDDTVTAYTSNGGTLGGANMLNVSGLATLNDASSVTGGLSGDTQTSGAVSIGGTAGGGTLTVTGGTLTITGSTSYAGGTFVDDGTLELNGPPVDMTIQGPLTVGDGTGAAGSAVADLQAPAQIANGFTVTVNADGRLNVFAETVGTLNVNGGVVDTGTAMGLSSVGATNLTGGTIQGAMAFAPGGDLNSLAAVDSSVISAPVMLVGPTTVNVADGAAADDLVISGLVSGLAGAGIAFEGAGTLVLGNGGNSYDGGTSINGGTLTIGATGATGTGPITVLGSTINYANGVNEVNPVILAADVDLNVNGGAAATQSGAISGAFGITKIGDGTLDLAGANTYTGATNVNAGTLSLSGSLASTTLGISMGAVFDAQSSGLAAGTNVANAGTLNVDADNTVNTYVSNGGLLDGAATLTAASYNLNNNSTVSGNLGTGTLNANGAVTYSGTSMADTVNIMSGTTNLTGAGQFGMDGSLFDISGGARLNLGAADYRFATIQGDGTVGGNLLIGGGDSIYPGTNGSVGTLSVDGDLTVMGAPGDTANVGIDVLGAAPGGFDVVNVSGNFGLGSDSHLMVNNPGAIGTLPAPIQIVNFGSQSGNFTSTNLLGAFGTLHVYNPAAGTIQPLNLAPSVAKSSYLIGNLNQNQSAGYRALFEDVVDVGFQNIIQVFYDGATGMPLPPGATPGYEDYFLLELDPGSPLIQDGDPQLRDALNATPLPGGGLSGAVVNLLLPEVHQGMADFTEQSMRGLVRLATRTAPVAEAGKTKVFAGVHSTNAGSTDSTTNASYDISLAGVVTGARYEVAPGFQIGALLGYDDGSIEGPLVDTDGSGYVLGVFGEYVIDQPSQTTVFASLSYGDYEYDAVRTSFGGPATASGIGADALEFAVGIRGVGYEVDNFRLIPNAMLRYMSGDVDGFTESGPGVPLWVSGYDFDSLLLEVGVDAELEVNDVVTVVGHIGFQTDFSDSGNSIGASFVNGMSPFTVLAPGVDDEAFVIAAGAYFDVTETIQLGVNWRSELRDSSQSVHSIGVGASFGF